MDRREMLGVLGVGTLGLTAFSSREARADEAATKLDAVHQECLEACSDCAKACDMTFHHCLMQLAEGKREHAKSVQYAADCAGFCALSACNIAKHSPLMAYSCEACAESCKATLAVVSKFDADEMKAAAKALTRCEKSCRSMLEAMGHHHHETGAGTAPRAN
jgi:predicted ATPase